MLKRVSIITVVLCLVAFVGGLGFAAWNSISAQPEFASSGYILKGNGMDADRLSFSANERYRVANNGMASFKSEGDKVYVPTDSFAIMDNGSVMALSDGILMDFNDLSANFINHYYISAKLPIQRSGDTYTAETTAGSMTFGDHMWKLSDSKYLVESPVLTVNFSETDIRPVSNYVQISVTDDGIVQLLTEENTWMTMSETCYVETASGVKVFPVDMRIENEDYKMSMAKISIDPEDSIVLSREETRRQIVPELNIEAVDGKNGSDGILGEEGQAGRSGAQGNQGDEGEEGSGGYVGTEGFWGEDGVRGTDGGSRGDGHNGSDGDDAKGASSTNTAMPDMVISEWDITATSVKGAVNVTDINGYLTEVPNFDSHKPTITIYEAGSEAAIPCKFLVDGAEKDDLNTAPEHESTIEFVCTELKPDTAYRISVKAYYAINSTTFCKEFISREFYTDSTGVFLSNVKSTTSSVTINVSRTPEVSQVTVYLLTPEQNASFTVASTACVASKTIEWGKDEKGTNTEVTFDKKNESESLPSDTQYIVRVMATATVGGTSYAAVTKQALKVTTLKKQPVFDSTAKPALNYNRFTGAYEVYRPQVTDEDNGVVGYTYTVYKSSSNEPVKTRTVAKTEGEPIAFFLPGGETYRVHVSMTFNDNEKNTIYDWDDSDEVTIHGDPMPGISLEDTSVDYNTYKGNLIISMGTNSTLTVDQNHPLELKIYADECYDRTVVIKGMKNPYTVEVDSEGSNTTIITAEATNEGSSNETDVKLDLTNLYKNTRYTITVKGYVNLGDLENKNDLVVRTLGSASFHTLESAFAVASYQKEQGSEEMTLQIGFVFDKNNDNNNDNKEINERIAYAKSQLEEGRIVLELYDNTGKIKLATKSITEEKELSALLGNGLEIVSKDGTSMFSSTVSLVAGQTYYVKLASIEDSSYKLQSQLDYVNKYSFKGSVTSALTKSNQESGLTTEPSQAIKVTPIKNSNASQYNKEKNANLPDDAIIGFQLNVEKGWDNKCGLGTSITYYAFELNRFMTTVHKNGTDPHPAADGSGGAALCSATVNFGQSEDTPGVAFIFTEGAGKDPYLYNGKYVKETGAAVVENEILKSGMERGWRYVFTYKVNYKKDSVEFTYPERSAVWTETDPYGKFDENYGAGLFGKKLVGQGLYILNSGIQSAPMVTPKFRSYLYKDVKNSNSNKLTLHYTIESDKEALINSNTKVSFGGTSQGLKTTPIGNDWYEAVFDYKDNIIPTDNKIKIATNISRYKSNYTDWSTYSTGDSFRDDDNGIILCSLPYLPEMSNQIQNEIKFKVKEVSEKNNDADNVVLILDSANKELMKVLYENRGVSAEVTVSTKVSGKEIKQTLYLPIDYNSADAEYVVKIPCGYLQAEFFGNDVKVSFGVSILYTDGNLGWAYLEEKSDLALQRVSDDNKFDKYLTINSNLTEVNFTDSQMNGYAIAVSQTDLLNNVRSSGNYPVPFKVTYYRASKQCSATYYLWTADGGLRYSNNSVSMGAYKLIPEHISKKVLTPTSEETITIKKGTPSIVKLKATGGFNCLVLSDLETSGLNDNGKTIYIVVYADDSLKEPVVGNENEPVSVEVNGNDGKYSGAIYLKNDKKNLLDDTPYYVALYYKDSTGTLQFMKMASDGSNAILKVKTLNAVAINEYKFIYENTDYNSKSLKCDYILNTYTGLKVKYSIRKNTEGKEELLTEEELKKLANKSEVTITNQNNRFEMNLTPSKDRKELQPGGTYILRLTYIMVGTTANNAELGYSDLEFTLPDTGIINASISSYDITDKSVTFKVNCITDEQNSIIARPNGATDGTGNQGVYAVRFTVSEDGVEKIVSTNEANEYHKKLYPTDKAEVFVLNGLDPEKDYKMYVYAIVDKNHDTKTNADLCNGMPTDTTAAEYFLGGDASKFHELIQGGNKEKFVIGTKKCTTNAEESYYLDVKNAKLTYQNETLALALINSAAIDDKIEVAEWTVQWYDSKGQKSVRSGGKLAIENTGDSYVHYQYKINLGENYTGASYFIVTVKLKDKGNGTIYTIEQDSLIM